MEPAPPPAPAHGRPWLRVAAAAIVALAAVLRLGWPSHVDWDGDFALHYSRAAEIARGERTELIGYRTSAGGAHLPPTFHLALAAPCLLGAGPVGATAFVALTMVAAVALLVTLGRRAWGDGVALLAGLLLATLPAAVIDVRSIRNETPLALLVVALLLLVERARRAGPSSAAGLGVATALIMPQLHLSALFFIPVPLLLLAGPLARSGLRRALPGLLLLLAITSPFLAHEARTRLAETRAFLRGVGGADVRGAPTSVHVSGAERLVGGPVALLEQVTTVEASRFVGPTLDAVARGALPAILRAAAPLVDVALPALVLLGLGLGLAAVPGGAGPSTVDGALRRAALALVGTFGMFTAGGVQAKVPYVFQLLPVCALLAAGAAVWLWRRAVALPRGAPRRAARTALVTVVGCAPLVGGALSLSMVAAEARSGGPLDKQCRGTYASKRAAIDWLLEHERALARYPGTTYLLTLDLAWRALPPEKRARFAVRREVVPYADQPYLLPIPHGPLRRASIYEADDEAGLPPGARVLARFASVVIVEG